MQEANVKIKKKLIKVVLSALIRNVGDTRECPHCRKIFIPEDRTAKESFEVYKELKQAMKKDA